MRSFIAIAVALLAASAVHAVPRPQTSGVTTLAKGDRCSMKSTTSVCGTGLICGENPAYVKGNGQPCHVCIDDPNYVAPATTDAGAAAGDESLDYGDEGLDTTAEATGDYGDESTAVTTAAPAATGDATASIDNSMGEATEYTDTTEDTTAPIDEFGGDYGDDFGTAAEDPFATTDEFTGEY